LFQLSNPNGTPDHPFIQIIRKLDRASDKTLDTLIARLADIRKTHLRQRHFIFVLDEAQQAARLYPYSFIASTNAEIFLNDARNSQDLLQTVD
jgi:hypothetical protein